MVMVIGISTEKQTRIKREFRVKDDSKVMDHRDECELQVSVGSRGSLYNLFALRRILLFEVI